MKLSIVVPYLNEGNEPVETLKSIASTADVRDLEVILVADGGDTSKPRLEEFPFAREIRLSSRQGVDWCRTVGVVQAKADRVLLLDAHMRFPEEDWLSPILQAIDDKPEGIYCSTCIRLDNEHLRITPDRVHYRGANMTLVTDVNDQTMGENKTYRHRDSNGNVLPGREVLEPAWNRKLPESYVMNGLTRIPIGCVLGAGYFFHKRWFAHILGVRGLVGWGTSEPLISAKSWMCGGEVELIPDVRIGHIFRNGNAPYAVPVSALLYNKLFYMHVVDMPPAVRRRVFHTLPPTPIRAEAVQLFWNQRKPTGDFLRVLRGRYVRSFLDYCKRFEIAVPT